MATQAKEAHLYIATPSYGGAVATCYVNGLLELLNVGYRHNLSFTMGFNNFESLVTRARNTMVAHFLSEEHFTHLMWIDGDIGFRAADVLRLLHADRQVAAGVYPLKIDGWPTDGLPEPLPAGTTRDGFRTRFARFPVSSRLCAVEPDEDGFVEVLDAPTGFMLIKREVLVELARRCPHLRYRAYANDLTRTLNSRSAEHLYTFFDTMVDPETGFYLSEDYAFCRRIAAIGIKPVVDTRSNLVHQGSVRFEGDFGRSLALLRGTQQHA